MFAFNSATHSGDGFFLWAGQTTMDSGQGGCNDNVIYGNDFSHSPCNGVEATFSRNGIVNNRIEDCWHGIWGGYSYETTIEANRFGGNDIAIAIEHGQKNRIIDNQFMDDRVGIRLWQNAKQDPNWGYPKHRDTRSRGYVIAENTFTNVATPEQVTDTEDIARTFDPPSDIWRLDSVGRLRDGIEAMLPSTHPRGRKYILVDEWGPYDFKSPRLWAREKRDGSIRYELLGPAGRWRLLSSEGVRSISTREGWVPGELFVQPDGATPVRIEMEYVGGEVVSPFGAITPPGHPYRFSARN
jgi:parallel beta-helix repeat protein